jgi:DNA uptake protein ComE-like DNA-binding protein
MNFKQFVQDYFTFSRNERKGITILLVLIFLLAVANKVVFYFETPAKIDTFLLDSAQHQLGLFSDSMNVETQKRKLFHFNPNLIDSIALDSLDLPIGVKRNLLKFRNKGGKFYSHADFGKIYGVSEAVYKKVEPFLVIEARNKYEDSISEKPELFPFDPNKATDADYRNLGLSEKLITTFRNYQNKGGTFRKKEDFLRMWGLTEKQKLTLVDFIRIEPSANLRTETKQAVIVDPIELNSADSTELEMLPGIGDKLSKRIVKYRDLLGGFHSMQQLKEVYGLNEQAIKHLDGKVTIDISKIRKLDLNFADVNELSRHPYLRKNLATPIVKFRTKNGSIRNLDVLRDSMILNIDDYNRLKPYF